MMFFFKKRWAKQLNHTTFDSVDVHQFHKVSFSYFTAYLAMWCGILISLAVLASDIYTAVMLLGFDRWSSSIKPYVPIRISRWLFAGCIILSVLLLIYNFIKAHAAVKTDNIAYIYTTPIARNYLSIKSYDHFCLFLKITKSRSKTEYLALFIYFSFKNWLGLIFAEGPRQAINALTLYSVLQVTGDFAGTVRKIGQSSLAEAIVLGLMTFSLFVWVLNFVSFLFGLVAVLPLLAHVKQRCECIEEYCCIRINRRIAKLVERKNKEGLVELANEKSKDAFTVTSSLDDLEKGATTFTAAAITFDDIISAKKATSPALPYTVKHSASQATLRQSPSEQKYSPNLSADYIARQDSNGSAQTYASNGSDSNCYRNAHARYQPQQPQSGTYRGLDATATIAPPTKAASRGLQGNGIFTATPYDTDIPYNWAPYPSNEDYSASKPMLKEYKQQISKTRVSGANGGPTYSVYNPFEDMSASTTGKIDSIPAEFPELPETELTDLEPTLPFTTLDNSSRMSRLDPYEQVTKNPTLPNIIIEEQSTEDGDDGNSDADSLDQLDLIDHFYNDDDVATLHGETSPVKQRKPSASASSTEKTDSLNREPTMLSRRINERAKLHSSRRSLLEKDTQRQPALPSFDFHEHTTAEEESTQTRLKKSGKSRSNAAGQYTSYDFF